MKNKNYFEIAVGTFVLICAGFFLHSSMKSAKIKNSSGYIITAKFDNASGIEAGSDIKISGVKIGTVQDFYLDHQNFRAVLKLQINNDVELPLDSSAKIVSAGLLGEKFLEINPGADEEILAANDEISFTQSSVNFEDLLSKFMFKEEK